jgi:hypothetical protein
MSSHSHRQFLIEATAPTLAALVALIAGALGLSAARAGAHSTEPAPRVAPRCPACIVAAPELIDLAGTAMIGATGGAAIERASEAVEQAEAVHTGARIARHPHAFRPYVRWANGNMASGRLVWKHVEGRLGRLYRWLRGSYSLHKLRKKLPRAAVACVVSGTITGIHTGDVRDALWSCLGGALGTLGAPKADRSVGAYAR